MTTPRQRLVTTAYRANELVQSTNIVGRVEAVHAPSAPQVDASQPTYTVRIDDRRNENYGDGAHSYLLHDVASAVPLQVGHRVFVTVVNGDIRQGVYITGTTAPPRAQELLMDEDRWQPLFRRYVTGADGMLVENNSQWLLNEMFTHSFGDASAGEDKVVQYLAAAGAITQNYNRAINRFLHDVTNPDALEDIITYSRTASYGTGPNPPPIFPISEATADRSNAPAMVNVLGESPTDIVGLTRRVPLTVGPSPRYSIVVTSPVMDFQFTFRIRRCLGYSWNIYQYEERNTGRVSATLRIPTFSEDLRSRLFVSILAFLPGGNVPPVELSIEGHTIASHQFAYKSAWSRDGIGRETFGFGAREVRFDGRLTFHDFEGTEFTATARLEAPHLIGEEVDINLLAGMAIVPNKPQVSAQSIDNVFGLGDVLATTFYTAGWSFELTELGVGSALHAAPRTVPLEDLEGIPTE